MTCVRKEDTRAKWTYYMTVRSFGYLLIRVSCLAALNMPRRDVTELSTGHKSRMPDKTIRKSIYGWWVKQEDAALSTKPV